MAFSLDVIQRKNTSVKPPIIVIHGGPGIGKTTFAASAPNPIFILTEDGLGLNDAHYFPEPKSFNEIMDYISALMYEKHDYNTLVIDSLSALEPVLNKSVAADHQKQSLEDFGYGKGEKYALDYWNALLGSIIKLRNTKNMIIILIAHSEIVRFDSPEVEPYNQFIIKLPKRAYQLLYEQADIIGFAQRKTTIIKADMGFNQKVNRAVDTGERFLFLEEKPAFTAKNRYRLPEEIPLSWETFYSSLVIERNKYLKEIETKQKPTQTQQKPQTQTRK